MHKIDSLNFDARPTHVGKYIHICILCLYLCVSACLAHTHTKTLYSPTHLGKKGRTDSGGEVKNGIHAPKTTVKYFGKLLWASLLSTLDEPEFGIITLASKVCLFVRNVFIAGFLAVYTANLASFLTRSDAFVGLNGFMDIGSTALGKHDVCIVSGGSIE